MKVYDIATCKCNIFLYFFSFRNDAQIYVTESLYKECEDMLKKMKKIWPQDDIDGRRNLWIIKPSDKSKGIGNACPNFEA